MKNKTYAAGLFVLMLINSFSFLHSTETIRSKEWIPEVEDSIKLVFYMSPVWDKTRRWMIETKNTFKIENDSGKSLTINIPRIDRRSGGHFGFYRIKDCSSINASFYVKFQENKSIADRIKIYWGENTRHSIPLILYNFTILKDGHFRVSKYVDESKPNWVCIKDGFATNWNPANKFNVIRIQQHGNECKISVNDGILMYSWLGAFMGPETGFNIAIDDSWDITKIDYAE